MLRRICAHLQSLPARMSIAMPCALVLSACATVETRLKSPGEAGIAYHLPSGLVRLTATEAAEGVITIGIAGPVMAPDPDAALVARLPRGRASNDTVTVSVEPTTRLLKKVEVSSTGKVGDIITNVVKSVAALQSATSAQGTIIFDKLYVIDIVSGTGADELNQALTAYFNRTCRRYVDPTKLPFSAELGKTDYKNDKATFQTLMVRCRNMSVAGLDMAASNDVVTIEIDASPALAPRSAVAPPPTVDQLRQWCARGVCYRPLVPRLVTLSVKGAFTRSNYLLFPDMGNVLRVDLIGGAFATQKYTLDFTDGVLHSYKQESESELVGLAKLPLDIVKAILSAPVEALNAKKQALDAESSYLGAVKTTADKKAEIAKVCEQTPQYCPDTAYRLIGVTINAPQASSATNYGGDPDAARAPVPAGNGNYGPAGPPPTDGGD